MDKLSKNILKYMNEKTDASSYIYTFGDDIEQIADDLSTDSESIRSAIRYLTSLQYVQYHYNGDYAGWFSLDHRGLHWQEFRWEERLKYLKDNWIDFLAMIFALASLIISITALSR